MDEAQAARGLLTAIFDNIGVVDMKNKPLSHRTFPWNVFNTPAQDTPYGMAASKSAYGVEAAGEVPTGCKNIRATVLDPL